MLINFLLPTSEIVIPSLSRSSALLLERTGIMVDGPFMSSFLPVSWGNLIKAKYASSHITLEPKTGCPLKLSRAEPGQYLDGRPPGKTRLLMEEVLVSPTGGAHPVVCVGPNTPV